MLADRVSENETPWTASRPKSVETVELRWESSLPIKWRTAGVPLPLMLNSRIRVDENQNQERRHAGEKSKQPALQGRPLMALLLPERQCLSEHRQAIRLLSPINPLLSYFSKGGFRPRVPAVQISFPP